jgi:hypothetical protein
VVPRRIGGDGGEVVEALEVHGDGLAVSETGISGVWGRISIVIRVVTEFSPAALPIDTLCNSGGTIYLSEK